MLSNNTSAQQPARPPLQVAARLAAPRVVPVALVATIADQGEVADVRRRRMVARAVGVAGGRSGVGLFRRGHRMLALPGGLLVATGLAVVAGAWVWLLAPPVRRFGRSDWPAV